MSTFLSRADGMNSTASVTYSLDADDVGWIVFDDPGARANILNAATQTALADALTEAERGSARAIVVRSGKERIFIAGADLNVIASLPDAAAAAEFARRGQQLFQRLAELRRPIVCAIHGACAGGGFELALACRWRMASDAPVTRIGLPETSIGTIPGWGGSVRLPRLIGVKPALDHLLAGQLVSAADALRAGMIDEVVPAAELEARAKAAALTLAAQMKSDVPIGLELDRATDAGHGNPALLFEELRAQVHARTRGRNPALLAAIDVVERTASLPAREALEIEARMFGDVTAGPVCKNLIRVFFLREAAQKRTLDGWFPIVGGALGPDTKNVTAATGGTRTLPQKIGVVGAGVMGTGVAQWLAWRGFDVVLRDVAPDVLDRGVAVIRGLFDEAVKRGKTTAGEANAALHRIVPTAGWDGFETCDLVVEAIVEDVDAKRRLFAELAGIVREETLLVSNTSALPIEEIAAHVPNPARTLGIHFFNPVSRMPLVELVVGRHTSPEAAERALAWVKALGKSPIVCRSSPGFLVTRVLFFYLNAAVRWWERGVDTQAIDDALREFGWPMGPLRLIDEVGVDVTDFIFGEMARYFPERFVPTRACARLLDAGLRGRKSGTSRGFYRYENSPERVNDAETRRVVDPRADASVPTDNRAQRDTTNIAEPLMRVMVDEARRCLEEGVVKSADDVDFALLSGAGFPPFRGGLLHWAAARSK